MSPDYVLSTDTVILTIVKKHCSFQMHSSLGRVFCALTFSSNILPCCWKMSKRFIILLSMMARTLCPRASLCCQQGWWSPLCSDLLQLIFKGILLLTLTNLLCNIMHKATWGKCLFRISGNPGEGGTWNILIFGRVVLQLTYTMTLFNVVRTSKLVSHEEMAMLMHLKQKWASVP